MQNHEKVNVDIPHENPCSTSHTFIRQHTIFIWIDELGAKTKFWEGATFKNGKKKNPILMFTKTKFVTVIYVMQVIQHDFDELKATFDYFNELKNLILSIISRILNIYLFKKQGVHQFERVPQIE